MLVVTAFAISWIYYILRFYLGYEYAMGAYRILDIFDLDEEGTVTVWLGSTLLAFAGLLALSLATLDTTKNRRHWLGVSALSIFLSLDEGAMVHERSELLAVSIVVFIFFYSGGIAHIRFINRIGNEIALHLILGACLFVLGSIVVDGFSSSYIQAFGRDNIGYRGRATLEEGLEFAGIFLILRGLMRHHKRVEDSTVSARLSSGSAGI